MSSTDKPTMNEIATEIMSTKRRRFIFSHDVYKCYEPVSEPQLFRLASGLNFRFTLELSKWLLLAGYGDIDGSLSFREEWFAVLKEKHLEGHVSFAQDNVGNCYSFSQKNGSIYHINRLEMEVSYVAGDFASFLIELIRRDYKLVEWMNSLPSSLKDPPY
jgi:hypothetical protein